MSAVSQAGIAWSRLGTTCANYLCESPGAGPRQVGQPNDRSRVAFSVIAALSASTRWGLFRCSERRAMFVGSGLIVRADAVLARFDPDRETQRGLVRGADCDEKEFRRREVPVHGNPITRRISRFGCCVHLPDWCRPATTVPSSPSKAAAKSMSSVLRARSVTIAAKTSVCEPDSCSATSVRSLSDIRLQRRRQRPDWIVPPGAFVGANRASSVAWRTIRGVR